MNEDNQIEGVSYCDKKQTNEEWGFLKVPKLKGVNYDHVKNIRKDWRFLKQLDATEQTSRICRLAARIDGNALQYVLNQDAITCILAIDNCGTSFQWVNDELRTDQLYHFALERVARSVWQTKIVKDEYTATLKRYGTDQHFSNINYQNGNLRGPNKIITSVTISNCK